MNFSLSFYPSIAVFITSSILVFYLCNKLSFLVDWIDSKFQLGSAFGGTLILSVVTNLPEIAITFNGALRGDTDLAVGNILGGIVIQSVLLVLFDFANRKQSSPLSTLTNSKTSILQGLFLIIILATAIAGAQLNDHAFFARFTIPEVMIGVVWVLSLLAMKKFQSKIKKEEVNPEQKESKLTKTSSIIYLSAISVFVLVFGVLLENSSNIIATHLHINGIIFGATVLAVITSLPEISGGLAFVKKKLYEPIISDIFGGNAFLPVLFLPATLISNKSILPHSSHLDIYLTTVAILITSVYLIGMIVALPQKKLRLGLDSWAVLFFYLLSVIGMFYM